MNSYFVEEIMTCRICLEIFNGKSRCPRILTCGHSFCHSCLEKLIEQNPRCHTCNRGFRFKKVVSIPINSSLKSLTKIKTEAISLDLQEGKTIESVPIHFPLKSLTNIKTEPIALDLQEGETMGSNRLNFSLQSLTNIKTEAISLDLQEGETIEPVPIHFPLKSLTNIKTEPIALDLQEGEKMGSNPLNFSLQSLTNNETEGIGSTSTKKSVRVLDLQEGETIGLDNCAAKRQRTKGKSFLSEGHCDEHDVYLGMRCMDCKIWICGMCVALKHKHCWTLVVEEAYIELKKQLSLKVETKLGERKETFVRLEESLRILDDERKSLIEEIEKKEQKLKDCEKRVRELESKKSDGRKFCQKLEQLHGLVERLSIGGELSKAIKELEKLLEEPKAEIPDDVLFRVPFSKKQLENWCLTESVFAEKNSIDGTKYGKVSVKDGQILIHNFQPEKPVGCIIPFKAVLSKFDGSPPEFPKTAFLRQLENWCLTESVYAQEDRFDGTKYGKVTVKDGRILVHNFQTEKPEGLIIPFLEVLSKYGLSHLPNTAFLRMTPTFGETIGFDILIKTDGTSPRARNFLLLCAALKGQTYKGTCMELAKFASFVPESTFYQMTRGPAPVVEGIKNNAPFKAIKKAGVYGTRSNNSCFFISWIDRPSHSFSEFGTVIAGLQELSEKKGRVSISDCGLVIGFL